ncbi:MAG: phosphatidylserine decarboxylase [Candidatus Electrothrix sp. ATG2]|nr:phosphatidylserine decarboxylase [Candidatus Electrothrix sp. ATG2]
MESKALVETWLKELGSANDDYVVPKGGYQSFNQFFSRELKYGRRPVSNVDDDSVVVSPCDGVINMIDDDLSIDRESIPVKTQKLSVTKLLNYSPLAGHFEGGTAVSCILMPTVYHHYHAPVSGIVVEASQDVAGAYFGIDDFPNLINGGNVGYGYNYSVFEQFRRGYMIIKTKKQGQVIGTMNEKKQTRSVDFNF